MLCNLSSILVSYNEAFSSIELNGGMMKGDFRYKQKAVYVCSSRRPTKITLCSIDFQEFMRRLGSDV